MFYLIQSETLTSLTLMFLYIKSFFIFRTLFVKTNHVTGGFSQSQSLDPMDLYK